MRIIVLCAIFLITCFGCRKNYCDFIEKNEDALNDLVLLIEKNPEEFSNSKSVPRSYYTYNYQKKISEFQQTKSSKNIDEEEYKILKKIFSQLSIEKFMIYDNQNILFKIKNVDLFVVDYNFYIGYLKKKSVKEVKKDFEITYNKKCVSNWYYLLERTSIAN